MNINHYYVQLNDEQFQQLVEAVRDGRAIVVSGEEAAPAPRPGIVKALPANVRQLPARKVG